MGNISGGWSELVAGEQIRTPFGDAVIKHVDQMKLQVETDLGTWEFAEVDYRGGPDEGEDVVDYLLGPRFSVATISDYRVTACTCDCKNCSHTSQRHKMTGRTTIYGHERRQGCNCHVQGCWCCVFPEIAGIG